MNIFKKFFQGIKNRLTVGFSRFRTVNGYQANFTTFGSDMYESEIVRACIRPLADQTAKARPVCKDEKLERLLTYRPNQLMSGRDFLYKIRTLYELTNTAVIVIVRDDAGQPVGFYPMTGQSYEAIEDPSGNVYLRYNGPDGQYVFAWEDLIILRKDYNRSDIAGDDNGAILNTLELINTSNESISNAVKTSASLRGILKSTKTMIDPKLLKDIKDEFVESFMDPSSGDGIGALDATTDFQQVNVHPEITNWATMKEFRENVFRYFGVNDAILMGTATPDQMQTFYELQIEPFLIALSQEMTRKVYNDRQIAFGNSIVFDSSTVQFMSMSDKLNLQAVVDRGAMTINEWRDVLNLPPVDGGDVLVRRLDTAPVDESTESEEEDEQGN